MTDENTPENSDNTPQEAEKASASGERIAKVMARAGVASRREAERMITEGRVSVNGKKIDSPALDVMSTDRVTVDGKRLEEPQETRLWLYYKPIGLITSESDEKGRQTIYDALPRDLPRVMTVGRLDLNSEGLLLLTNDGELKRRLELPATGWLRRYRVRVNGTPNDLTFAPLRRGVTIDGEEFAPMEIKLDSQQGANAWLTVGIREGKNREIRRAMSHIGLQVNRLIRIGYGPFKLIGLEKNQVSEVKRRVLRDQLGGLLTGEVEEKPREMRPRGAEGASRRPYGAEAEAGERPRRFAAKPAGEGRFGDRPRRVEDGDRPKRFGSKPGESRYGDRPTEGDGDRPRRFGGKPAGDARFGDRPRRADDGDRPKRFGDKPAGESRYGDKPHRDDGDRPKRFGGKPAGEARFGGARDQDGERPRRFGDKPAGERRFGDAGARRSGDEASGERKPRSFGKASGPREAFGEKREARPGKPFPRKDAASRDAGEGFRGKPSGKPGGRPSGKPGGFSGGRPTGASGRPSGGPGGRPSGKPGGGAGGRPGGKPGGKPRG